MELDENSRLSADSRVSDSNSMQAAYSERPSNIETNGRLCTIFSKEMFQNDNNVEAEKPEDTSSSKVAKVEQFHSEYIISENFSESPSASASKGIIYLYTY